MANATKPISVTEVYLCATLRRIVGGHAWHQKNLLMKCTHDCKLLTLNLDSNCEPQTQNTDSGHSLSLSPFPPSPHSLSLSLSLTQSVFQLLYVNIYPNSTVDIMPYGPSSWVRGSTSARKGNFRAVYFRISNETSILNPKPQEGSVAALNWEESSGCYRATPTECTPKEIYRPPQVNRIWLWVYYNKIPIYPIFYLHTGDYKMGPQWDYQHAMGGTC